MKKPALLCLLACCAAVYGQTVKENKPVPSYDVPPPLKCGPYQHVEHWPGGCGPARCDEKSMTCDAICMPAPLDHCADDLHWVTERDWQALLRRLEALEKTKQYPCIDANGHCVQHPGAGVRTFGAGCSLDETPRCKP